IIHAYKKKIDLESLYTLEKKNHEQEQELNQERLRFYTNITHELRTPLTLILGPLEDMQKDTSLPTRQAQKLSVIHLSALRLLNLINQILEFRKTETQNKKLCVCKGNIVPLIHEIGLKYKELNQKKAIDFQIQIEKEEMPLFFDKEIITIILDNLISNAIKYTEQGKITLSLYPTTRNGVTYTEIKVSDTGYGISAEALPHVFDRYYQESGKHQASGTGIGLALVRNLVELHEGEIRVESIQNEGSTFYISLLTDNIYPNALHGDSTKQTEEEMISEAVPEDSQNTEPETSKPILLIVEDNEDIQKYIAESFSDSFEVITGSNGEEGKQQALNRIPDIIVSDIMMPVMDGITLCRQLKEDVRTSHIPVILLTAKDSLQDKEEGYEVGADSYLTKPFSASLLRSRINNLLDSRKKLIAQFQQTGTNHNPNSHLDEKRSIITEALSKLDNEFIEKITQLVEDNLSSEKIDITYLSDKMCMSGSTLYRKMKALTGLSTNEYIRKVKMQNAERLLLEGKYNISEIAYKIGMNSTGYFRQCFKDEFGVSPSDYLKQFTSPTPPPSS
ncbi:response regulator, partial [Akkermansia sp. BIOML-A54]